MNRRDFVKLCGAALAGSSVLAPREVWADRPGRARLKKAVMYGMVETKGSVLEKFRLVKSLGFDGIEMRSQSGLDLREVLRARDAADLPIHGLTGAVHWQKTLGDPDPAIRAEGLAALRTALEEAHAYGASNILLVPAVVKKEISYADAYTRSHAEIRKALPLAERLGVKIAVENVWNNFLLSPLEFARYVDELESPWVGAYFDVGNVVNHGWPEHWIRTLGPRILKVHIKEYSTELRDEEGPRAGFRAEIGEGSVDWPAVRRGLAEIGYEGWATAEVRGGDAARLAEISAQMDRHVLGGL